MICPSAYQAHKPHPAGPTARPSNAKFGQPWVNKKSRLLTIRWTDRLMDGPTDGPTGTPTYTMQRSVDVSKSRLTGRLETTILNS